MRKANSAMGGRICAFRPGCLGRQQGVSLVVSLLMLSVVLMLSISAAQIALQGEKASRNDRERQIALQAAEAALMDAELDIEGSPDKETARSQLFASHGKEDFSAGCGSGLSNIYLGLCSRAEDREFPVWRTVDFLDESAQARSVPYGHFTGHRMQTGAGLLPAKLPRYIIELMSYDRPGEAVAKDDPIYFYRITAVGFGMRETTRVMLQASYRKVGDRNVATIVPAGRFSWREIVNWQELHDAFARS